MEKINLKEIYYFVKQDSFLEVQDEVLKVFKDYDKENHNYDEKRKYWNAVFSLDATPALENHATKKSKTTEEIVIENYIKNLVMKAIGELTPVQKRRIVAYYFYEMRIVDIARMEQVDKRAVRDSLMQAEKKLKKILKNTPLFNDFSAVE